MPMGVHVCGIWPVWKETGVERIWPPSPSQQLLAAPGPRKTRGIEGEAAPGALREGSGMVHWVSDSDGSDKFEWESDGNWE